MKNAKRKFRFMNKKKRVPDYGTPSYSRYFAACRRFLTYNYLTMIFSVATPCSVVILTK